MSFEITPEDFYANRTDKDTTIFCYHAIKTTSAGIWLADNPLLFSLPLLLFQITLIFLFTRITHSLLRRLSIPLVISQIIAGILLGPSCLGRYKSFHNIMFSSYSWEQLNTISLFSLMLFLFIIGLKTDLAMIPKSGKKALGIALCSTILPHTVTGILGVSLNRFIPLRFKEKFVILNMTYSWSISSYSVVSCALADLNLLTSKLGRLAMSATLITDLINLFITAVLGSYLLARKNGSIAMGITAMAAFLAFVVFLVFVARPATILAIKKTPAGAMLGEACFVGVLLLAIGCGFLSELIGYHATMGPFLLGLILPGGAPLGVTMVEKLERLVEGVFLPVFLASAGLRMDVASLGTLMGEWSVLLFFLVVVVTTKFVGAALPCLYCKMPLRDCIVVGLMMISKGIYEIDAACRWQDAKIVDRQLFTVLVLTIIAVGGGSAPLIKCTYRPEDRFVVHKRRAVQFHKSNDELPILACIHGQEHVNGILTLLESFHPTTITPVCLYAIHLKPLAGRAATVLQTYTSQRTPFNATTTSSDTDHIFNAFLQAEQLYSGCSITPYICISPYSSMHEDICSLALDKKAFLIILPFHKHLNIDGSFTTPNPSIQAVNAAVLRFAPCSVAVLVNYGLTGESAAFRAGAIHCAAVYFFGGADDREALACGLKMAEDSAFSFTVVRFRVPEAELEEAEERLDERMLEEARVKRADGNSVVYREELVTDGEGTVGVIREISKKFSLLLVGRENGKGANLMSGLSMWSEYPELGIIGDLLASTDFGGRVSTLVVQQQRRRPGNGVSENLGMEINKGVSQEDNVDD